MESLKDMGNEVLHYNRSKKMDTEATQKEALHAVSTLPEVLEALHAKKGESWRRFLPIDSDAATAPTHQPT